MNSKIRIAAQNAHGMTLIEIMVVITILGLIATLISISVVDNLNKAKVEKAKIEIQVLDSAIQLFFSRTGHYPSPVAGLSALQASGVLKELKPDPWGNDYIYKLEEGEPLIMSYGRDGTPGGSEYNADLTNRTRPQVDRR